MKKQYRSVLSIGLLSVLVVSLVFMLTGCGFFGQSPTAKISVDPDTSVNVGDEVTFDGGDSDPSTSDGEITSYDWTFPDEFDLGSEEDKEVQTGSFNAADTHIVSLEVEDDAGKTDSTSVEVEVIS